MSHFNQVTANQTSFLNNTANRLCDSITVSNFFEELLEEFNAANDEELDATLSKLCSDPIDILFFCIHHNITPTEFIHNLINAQREFIYRQDSIRHLKNAVLKLGEICGNRKI